MMNDHYTECRTLPAINETFPQFSTRPPALQSLPLPPPPAPPLHQHQHQHHPHHLHPQHTQQQRQQIAPANNRILSPLDLSLRAGVNIVPITPPSTPSPPRKRARFMTDEPYLWRPHVMGTPHNERGSTTTTTTEHKHALPTMTYTRREDLSSYAVQEEGYATGLPHTTFIDNRSALEPGQVFNSFGEMPKSQRTASMMDEYQRQPQQQQQQQLRSMATIYVDEETIVLTEDEDAEEEEELNNADEDDGEGEGEGEGEADAMDSEVDEENETLVSSQELNEDVESNEAHHHYLHKPTTHIPLYNNKQEPLNSTEDSHEAAKSDGAEMEAVEQEEQDEEEYVDILSNDDDDINPLSSKAITMLRLQSQTNLEQELAKSGHVLTRNKLVYENEELHNRAVDGLAKLFDRDFPENSSNDTSSKGKTYIDLTNCQKPTENPYNDSIVTERQEIMINPSSSIPSSTTTTNHHPQVAGAVTVRPTYKTHKTERKRMKLRKHMIVDEETISPVSGTIIRKLRDDEELVVRKGDIDPAFNVVEVTEEAKAILASIDNKIGAYLCQLCRTLYDDAFKLAQHRCPRIVHIEYKCSECEKVFNCPANLASHRRWHKPKSELLANSQAKKRQHSERIHLGTTHSPDKNPPDDGVDGIYPCSQCGKTFRRHAYLKKHQASHQMLENLKSLDIFKAATTNPAPVHPANGHHGNAALNLPPRIQTNPLYPPLVQPRPYPHNTTRFGTFPFGAPFDHRRFYTLGEFYLSQQLERSSAFQYVQANHLRNLSNVAGNFGNRPVAPSPIVPLPVK